MNRLLRTLFFYGLLIVVLALVVRYTHVFPSIKNLFKPKQVVVDQTPLLVTEIRNIAQLMTIEAYNEVVVDSTRYPFGISPRVFNAIPGSPFGLFGASRLVLIVRGNVVAGVDLKNLSQNAMQVRNDSLFVQLPRAAVLDVITNPSDVEFFIEEGTWDERAATILKLKARAKLVQQALAGGALPQADAKARQLVYELLKNVGYKSVTVSTAIEALPSGKQ